MSASYRGEDGRWYHYLRQSWIKTADTCLEQARRDMYGLLPERETDAANVGTAVHSSIEYCCEEQGAIDADTAVEVFHRSFTELMADPAFVFVKYTERSARKFGEACVRNWHELVLPTLELADAELEVEFDLPFYEDGERVIRMGGIIDYFDGALMDWKTSGRGEYTKWEHERWNVQATIYTWAAQQIGLVEYVPEGCIVHDIAEGCHTCGAGTLQQCAEPERLVPFEFVVMHPKGVQRFTVDRGPDHWDWLVDKSLSYARLIEAELSEWPKQDNHALCSEKWCSAWDTCKGEFLMVA